MEAANDCPKEPGPAIFRRARAARSDRRIGVVLAKCEYEAWFLGATESIAGRRGVDSRVRPPEDPEAIRDAKGWLS